MRQLLLLIVILTSISYVAALDPISITEFCPDPYLRDDVDEYLVLSGHGPLDGVTISDGKSGFRFPPGSMIDGTLTLARNGLAFSTSHGSLPDFEWQDSTPTVPNLISSKVLRMANANDSLMLYRNGQLIQRVSWPGEVQSREGQVHYLENGVWDPRPLMLGQSRFSPAEFRNVSVTAFVSPDCSDAVFDSLITNSRQSIRLNVYEFSSPSMADTLVQARKRGVDIRMLIEGGPVGGISSSEKAALWNVNQSGIPVYAMISSKDTRAPYRFDHAKYVVSDDRSVLVVSENFKYSGFAPSGKSGNRGWGVVLTDPGVALYFTRVFDTDIHGPATVPYTGTLGANETASAEDHSVEFTPQEFTGATVYPVLAPDTSYLISDLIASAGESIDIEEAYITNETRYETNPYLATAINASRRGVRVRILLDSYWYNTDGKADNDEMVSLINRIAATEHLPLEARCASLHENRIEKIHNKGVIIDNTRVLISSINWNSNSPHFNREAGVIIDHPGVAGYFSRVFEDDWNPGVKSPRSMMDSLKATVALLVVAALVAFWYYRRR